MFKFLSFLQEHILIKKVRKIRRTYKHQKEALMFDLSDIDNDIAHCANKIYQKNSKKFMVSTKSSADSIALLATMLYDSGGHTPCVLSFLKSFYGIKTSKLFLSENAQTITYAPKKLAEVNKYAQIFGLDYNKKDFSAQIIMLYNEIIAFSPSCLFVFIHPDDILMTAVLALLKRHTDIKVIYFNHASHYPNLGMNFADLVLEGMLITQYVTENYRHIHKCQVFGLQSKAKEETFYYSQNDIGKKRQELHLPQNAFVTMSGASSYKFFDQETSPYFKMIKELLQAEPELHHIVISKLSEDQEKIVDDIFLSDPSSTKNRLHFFQAIPDFDLLFQCADVFIDSFPVSSALTQIDLMRNKVPTVVKINAENALYSFHEYMPQNYAYMFETVEGMKDGVLKLLHSQEEQEKVREELYQYYLDVYEESVVKEKYLKIIENKDNLEKIYTKLDEERCYNIKGLR